MSATLTLDDLRHDLPRGPEQKSALDRIVDQLTDATNSRGLHEKLVSLGWITPEGRERGWEHWQAEFPQPVERYYGPRRTQRTR